MTTPKYIHDVIINLELVECYNVLARKIYDFIKTRKHAVEQYCKHDNLLEFIDQTNDFCDLMFLKTCDKKHEFKSVYVIKKLLRDTGIEIANICQIVNDNIGDNIFDTEYVNLLENVVDYSNKITKYTDAVNDIINESQKRSLMYKSIINEYTEINKLDIKLVPYFWNIVIQYECDIIPMDLNE